MEKIALTEKERKEVEKLIEKLFSLLEIEGTFSLEEKDEILEVLMETKDTGIVIGYHGEVLESLQLILSLAIAKKIGRFIRVSIEVMNTKRTVLNILTLSQCKQKNARSRKTKNRYYLH